MHSNLETDEEFLHECLLLQKYYIFEEGSKYSISWHRDNLQNLDKKNVTILLFIICTFACAPWLPYIHIRPPHFNISPPPHFHFLSCNFLFQVVK